MAIQTGGRGPYATTSSVVAVFEKHRQVGLRTISADMMPRIGVSESLAGRTVQTLVLLDFYDEKGQVTPAFDALRKMSDDEAHERLASMLREAYAEVLKYIDPATATVDEIERQFRAFEPTGQVSRMVQLFIGLFTYAGVIPPSENAPRAHTTGNRGGRPKANTNGAGGTKGAQPPKKPNPKAARPVEDPPSPPAPPDNETPTPPQNPPARSGSGEQVVIDLGDAGTVSINVDVRWLSLPDETFTKLRQGIRDLEALGGPAAASPTVSAAPSTPEEGSS